MHLYAYVLDEIILMQIKIKDQILVKIEKRNICEMAFCNECGQLPNQWFLSCSET